MDTTKIITQYKNITTPIYRLADGGLVIGEVVDDQNMLWYVVRRDKQITVETAINAPIIESFATLRVTKL